MMQGTQRRVSDMAETVAKRQDGAFQIKGLTGLSRTATRFLKQHPNRAELAVKVALETAASQFDESANTEGVPDALKPFVVVKPRGTELIGVSEAASRLNVSRTTVYDWAEKGTLLAWRGTKRGLTIPAEQILGEGRVVEGIDRVIDIIGDPELAWEFLSVEGPFADRTARPIDMLKEGRLEEVLGAAASYGTATT